MRFIQEQSDEFLKKYTLRKNHIDSNASWNGCMYETFGDEVVYVFTYAKVEPNKVWTLVETDKGSAICNGFHIVNRLGYFITHEAGKDGEDYIDIERRNIREVMELGKVESGEFYEKYKFIPNPYNEIDVGDEECLDDFRFEQGGEELEYVLKVADETPRKVWSELQTAEGLRIVNGCHNRCILGLGYSDIDIIGFYITEEEGQEGEQYFDEELMDNYKEELEIK